MVSDRDLAKQIDQNPAPKGRVSHRQGYPHPTLPRPGNHLITGELIPLQGADVYTGGFGAKFSGAIASTMDVRIRTGNMKEFNASVSADPFQTSFLAEGPVVKKNESRKRTCQPST